MKFLVASILAMAFVACVVPADSRPEPQPEAAPASEPSAPPEKDGTTSNLWNAVFLCVNNVGPSCIQIPATFPHAHDDCVSICRQDGTPQPICRITPTFNVEC